MSYSYHARLAIDHANQQLFQRLEARRIGALINVVRDHLMDKANEEFERAADNYFEEESENVYDDRIGFEAACIMNQELIDYNSEAICGELGNDTK